jgi:hypothetical protein
VKSFDDISYVAIGMGWAAAGFFIAGLLRYHLLLPVLASSALGSAVGLIAAAIALRQKELPFSATLGDMKTRLRREGVKGESIVVNNPNWKMRGLGSLGMGLSLVALSGYMLIDTYIRHIPTLSILWVMLATGVVVAAMGIWIMQRQSSSQLAD